MQDFEKKGFGIFIFIWKIHFIWKIQAFIDFSVAHSFLPNLKKSKLLRFLSLEKYFSLFLFLFKKNNSYHLFFIFSLLQK
jgi:hypothetical protein